MSGAPGGSVTMATKLAAGVVAGLMIMGAIVLLTSGGGRRSTEILGEAIAGAPPAGASSSPFPPYDGSCQVDPIHVSYAGSFESSQYRVQSVDIAGVQSECDGATLTVRLQDGDILLDTGSATATPSLTRVPMPGRPPVGAVTNVHVEIAGGAVPVANECSALALDQPIFGTPGADTLSGTPRGDLLYGLGGNDVIDGLADHDCLVGGVGDDNLGGGAGNDVILGGDGADSLYGGPGSDTIYGGAGDDFIDGGPGRDICYRGGGNDTVTGCEVIRS